MYSYIDPQEDISQKIIKNQISWFEITPYFKLFFNKIGKKKSLIESIIMGKVNFSIPHVIYSTNKDDSCEIFQIGYFNNFKYCLPKQCFPRVVFRNEIVVLKFMLRVVLKLEVKILTLEDIIDYKNVKIVPITVESLKSLLEEAKKRDFLKELL